MRDTSPAYYQKLWDDLVFLDSWRTRIASAARKVEAGRSQYRDVEIALGIPWAVVGVVHLLEGGGDFAKQILNGERWDRVTTLVPKGRGPWASWLEAALEGFAGFRSAKDIAGIGAALERHNGMGYVGKGKNSPYLVSGAKSGVGVGKYTKDGPEGWDPNAVSQQVGALCVLKQLSNVGAWRPEIRVDNTQPVSVVGGAQRTPAQNRIVQQMVNALILELPASERPAVLDIDGKIGPRTREAAARFGITL
jgi:lysozyme family protein